VEEENTLDGLQVLTNFEQVNGPLARTQRLAGLGTMAASVAHELSNPLSIITSTCNNLLSQVADGTLTTDQLLHYIEMVDHSAWRCIRLVQTMRTYTHPEIEQTVATSLNKLIEDGVTLVAHQFRRQYHVRLEMDLAPGLPPVICDPNQIIQVLVNLLLNARDALLPAGGVVKVDSRPLPEENAVTFSVCDSGPGIPAEIRDRIFEPFFTTKPPGEGSGLGLAIVAGIVEQHHGRIEVINNPGGGATFQVVLPCRQDGKHMSR
jgi:signal transduction histidine kinase